jgi:hypothetical protein
MPAKRRFETREPTMVDVMNVLISIGTDFSLAVKFEVSERRLHWIVVARAISYRGSDDGEVFWQALRQIGEKSTKSMECILFDLAYDLYMQADTDGLYKGKNRPKGVNELGKWKIVPG